MGNKIVSRPVTPAYEENYERIFGKKLPLSPKGRRDALNTPWETDPSRENTKGETGGVDSDRVGGGISETPSVGHENGQ